MCGIFGVVYYGSKVLTPIQVKALRKLTSELLLAAEMRGRDASGAAILSGNEVVVFKAPLTASKLIKTEGYDNLLMKINPHFRAVIGHARAQTKGHYSNNRNNHPIIAGKVVGVHNGMIGNDDLLFARFSDKITRAAQVDSEIIFRLLNYFLSQPDSSLVRSVQATSELILGSYACAFIDSNRTKFITIFKHWNPIDIIMIPNASLIVFASVGFTAKRAIGSTPFTTFSLVERDMSDNTGARISVENGDIEFFPLKVGNVTHPYRSVGADLLLPAPTSTTPSSGVPTSEEALRTRSLTEVIEKTDFSESKLLGFMRRIMRRD